MPPHTPLIDRLMARVEQTETCWLWTGTLTRTGYGMLTHSEPGVSAMAYRALYQLLVGPVPDGLQLDHLCRVRQCVNPAHLEPVTRRENMARSVAARTHCKNEHPFDDQNTYLWHGERYCRACNRDAQQRRRKAEIR